MAECSSCGVPVTSAQKFCRACGARVERDAPPAPPLREDPCGRCGQRIAPGAKFCRQCGASADRVDSTPRNIARPNPRPRKKRSTWVVAALAAAACVALAAGAFVVWSLVRTPAPDSAAVQAAISEQLPPYVHLQSITL